MPVIAGGGAQELHHGLPAPGALAVEQAMGIGLGDGIVHQLQAGVAAHEHLLTPAAQNLGKKLLGGRQTGHLAIVAHVNPTGEKILGLFHQVENHIGHHVQLGLSGLAPGHVQAQLLRLDGVKFFLQAGILRLPLFGGHLRICSHVIGPFHRKYHIFI